MASDVSPRLFEKIIHISHTYLSRSVVSVTNRACYRCKYAGTPGGKQARWRYHVHRSTGGLAQSHWIINISFNEHFSRFLDLAPTNAATFAERMSRERTWTASHSAGTLWLSSSNEGTKVTSVNPMIIS